jgi:4-coumarate--CoA ligase
VNPGSNAEELAYHLHISGAMSLVAHPNVLHVATKAAEQSGISPDRLVLLGTPERVTPNFSGYNLPGLIEFGLSQEVKFVECRLEPGGAKTRVAFLLFSSGTTGKPKVRTLGDEMCLSLTHLALGG